MKITEIKPYPVRRNLFLVRIETADGLYGWGEAGPSAWGRELAAQGAVTHIRELLLGKDARYIGALWQEMYRRGSGFEGGSVESAIISAIDIALHDLVAKSLGVPVYCFLGGMHRHTVPCFTPIMNPDAPDAVEITKRMLEEGWDVLRLSIGGQMKRGIYDARKSLAATAEGLIKLRDAVGPGPVAPLLRCSGFWGQTVDLAKRVGPMESFLR